MPPLQSSAVPEPEYSEAPHYIAAPDADEPPGTGEPHWEGAYQQPSGESASGPDFQATQFQNLQGQYSQDPDVLAPSGAAAVSSGQNEATGQAAGKAGNKPGPRRVKRGSARKPLIINPWMRQLAYVGGGIIGVFVLVVFVLPFFLPSGTIAREVSRQVEQATGLQLSIEGPVSVGVFPSPRFSAADVMISADGESSILRADSIRFGINLAAIFTGNVRLDEVTLDRPSVDLVVDERGRAGWLQASTAAGLRPGSDQNDAVVVEDTGSALQALDRLQIDAVTIRDGSIRYQDLRDRTDHLVSGIELNTALTSLDVPMVVDASFVFQDQKFAVKTQLDEPRAAIERGRSALDMSVNGSVLEASLGGTVDFALGPAFGGQFVSSIPSVAAMAAWLGTELPEDTTGLDSIRLSAELAASPVSVEVTEFALMVGEETVEGTLRADLTSDIPALSGDLVSQGVDVGTLMSAVGLAGKGQPSLDGSLIIDLQFAAQGMAADQLMTSLNARGSLGLRSGSISGTGLGLALGEAHADTISNITANITINTLDTPIGLLGQADWRDERFEMSGQFGAGQMLSNGMGPAQFGINSRRVSAGIEGTFTQTGDFNGNVTVETRSVRNLLAWLNQPIGEGGGLGPFSYTGKLSLSPGAVNFENARILLDGTEGTGNGTISFSGRPRLEARLALQQLDLTPYLSRGPAATRHPVPNGSNLPGIDQEVDPSWSNAPIDLAALSGMDADLTISARELIWDDIRTGATNMVVAVNDGVMTADLTEMRLYGGRGAGRLRIDASGEIPVVAINFDLSSLDAYPFLRDAAHFTRLEGIADFSIALKTQGRSELGLVSGLDGETRMMFANGALRGVNIPKMVRTLSARTLLGWQTNEQEKTDFSEFSGSFQFANGLGRTRDIRLIGPLIRATGAGSIDLPAKRLEMRFDPRVVASLQGQGAAQDFAGLGVPIVVEGALDQPRIYPDIAGILENPDAALEQLRQFGGGLAALSDDGDALRDQVRERTGLDVNQIMRDGQLDRDAAIGQGADLLGRLIGGNQSQTGPGSDTRQLGPGGTPVPRPDPRGSLVRTATPVNASPRFMTPAEARRATGGRATVSGGGASNTSTTSTGRAAGTAPAPSGNGGPIDLLNSGRTSTQDVLPGSGNPPGPAPNPVEGLLRRVFGR
uniref:AsmA family protein n=1 Tax=Pararhizobium sp. IMCC3301 TaxID=3067904 RepID=UPI002741EA6C|nr:AsmA family protein [Pararhizobium sp. IMCC3301]